VLKEQNLPLDSFEAGKDRTGINEIQLLLGYNDRKKKYATFPPILYKDLKDDPLAMFMNPCLPKVQFAALDDHNY
jgi:hypothetical protein